MRSVLLFIRRWATRVRGSKDHSQEFLYRITSPDHHSDVGTVESTAESLLYNVVYISAKIRSALENNIYSTQGQSGRGGAVAPPTR